jgi:hypothetical protein
MSSPSLSQSVKKVPEKVKKQKEKKPQTLSALLQWRMSKLNSREARLVHAIEAHEKGLKVCKLKLENVRTLKAAEKKSIEELVSSYKAAPPQ